MSPTDCLGISWTGLVERLDLTHALARWAVAEPMLARVATFGELATRVHSDKQPERTDELFGALLRLAAADAGGDEDAGLLIAHLLSNGTRKLAIDLRDLSPDIDAVIAGALWVEIRAFRWRHRCRGYAKSLLRDTRRAVLADLCPYRVAEGGRRIVLVEPMRVGELSGATDPHEIGSRRLADAEQELLDVFAWAQRNGVVDAADIALLVEIELAGTKYRVAKARVQRVSERTLRRRRNRILRALRDAVMDYLDQAA